MLMPGWKYSELRIGGFGKIWLRYVLLLARESYLTKGRSKKNTFFNLDTFCKDFFWGIFFRKGEGFDQNLKFSDIFCQNIWGTKVFQVLWVVWWQAYVENRQGKAY